MPARRAAWAFGAMLAACAGGAPPERGRAVDELVVGLESDPTNLDPRRAADAASSRILDLVCEGLLREDASGRPVPALARSWEARDARTFRFELVTGATFHDGSSFGAEDVVATLRSILDPATASPHRGSLQSVAEVEVEGPHAVVVRLREPYAPLLSSLTRCILPSEQVSAADAAEVARAPLGTGPYRVTEAVSGERVVLRAAPSWRGAPPRLERITFRVVADETTRRLELRKGSVDLVLNGVDPDGIPAFAAEPDRFWVQSGPSANTTYLGFNLADPTLADVRVRRAIALAIDRATIVTHLLGGRAVLARGLLPPEQWAADPTLPELPYDPEAAGALLDAAGWPDPDGPDGPAVRFTLVHKTSENRLRQRIAVVIQDQLRRVGIGVTVSASEWGTFFDDVKRGAFQTFTLTWVGIQDPDIFHTTFHSANVPPAGANRGRVRNPALDALAEAGRRTLDLEARRDVYARLQAIVAADPPYVFLWHEQHVAIATARLRGFELVPSGDLASLARAWLEPRTGGSRAGAR